VNPGRHSPTTTSGLLMSLLKLALATTALVGCGEDSGVPTDARGGETAGMAGASGAAGSAGSGGEAGTAGDAGAGGTGAGAGAGGTTPQDPGFQLSVETILTRPGRPRGLQADGSTLLWVLGTSSAQPAGAVETYNLESADKTKTFPVFSGDPPIWSAAIAGGDASYFAGPAAPLGGLLRRAKSGQTPAEPLPAPTPPSVALDLAVASGQAYAVYAGEHNESWVEAIDTTTGVHTRVSQAKELDAYVGDLVVHDGDVFYAMEAYGEETGFYRIAGGATVATRLPGTPPSSTPRFAIIGDELLHFERAPMGNEQRLLARSLGDGTERTVATTPVLSFLGPPVSLPTFGLTFFIAAGNDSSDGSTPWRIAGVIPPSPPGQGTPLVQSFVEICPADPWLPSLLAVGDTMYVSCPGDGTIKRVTVTWHLF
jgi:hypothetical protein